MSLKGLTLGALAGAAVLLSAGAVSAQASLATGYVSFVQPNGTAGPNDVIEVYLRLTLDEASVALSVDEFGVITSGGPSLSEIADAGIDLNQPYGVALGGYVGCGGSFFPSGCSGGEYELNFQPRPVNFTLSGGEFIEFLWLTFTPSGGPAAAGVYNRRLWPGCEWRLRVPHLQSLQADLHAWRRQLRLQPHRRRRRRRRRRGSRAGDLGADDRRLRPCRVGPAAAPRRPRLIPERPRRVTRLPGPAEPSTR